MRPTTYRQTAGDEAACARHKQLPTTLRHHRGIKNIIQATSSQLRTEPPCGFRSSSLSWASSFSSISSVVDHMLQLALLIPAGSHFEEPSSKCVAQVVSLRRFRPGKLPITCQHAETHGFRVPGIPNAASYFIGSLYRDPGRLEYAGGSPITTGPTRGAGSPMSGRGLNPSVTMNAFAL